jgi:pimeloyl-ACP methyl ester carboxylesterase
MPWFEDNTNRIYYEEQGRGVPVLVLPGFGGSITEFAPLRDALAPHYRVIAADLPGSGRSEPQPRAYPPTYYADDARSFTALLDHLQAESAHLIGFSDGGEVALLMAEFTPTRVRSLAVWGAAAFVPESMGPALDGLAAIVDTPDDPFGTYLRTTYGEANARAMVQNLAQALRGIMESGGDISRSRLGEIRCPVLFIAGEQDFIAPPAYAAELASHIPTAEVRAVEGAGHWVHQDRTEWLIQTVCAWLDGQGARAAALGTQEEQKRRDE